MTGYPSARSLRTNPVHLGLGAAATVQPDFTGPDWYDDYAARTSGDGKEGRLVAIHDFTQSWESWEMHPQGDEVVVCISGALTLVQQVPDGPVNRIALGPGDYAINPAGTWHTADAGEPVTALFITAGTDTQHRPR